MYKILQSAALIAALTLLTNLLGFAREVLFARAFGATQESDSFVSAFSIIATCFLILTAGSLQGAFMPRYQEAILLNRPALAKGLWRSSLLAVILFSGSVSMAVFVCADPIVAWVLPGFDQNARMLTGEAVRWLAPMILACSLGSLFQSILHANNQFALPALVPVANNIIIIVLLVALVPSHGLWAMSLGVVGGSLLWLTLWPFSMKFVPSGQAVVERRQLWELLLAIVPLMLLMLIDQVSGLIQKFLVSDLETGSISVLSYAARLQGLPVGILAGSIAAVIFPSLVEAFAKGVERDIREKFKIGIASASFLLVPSAAFLIMEAELVVSALLERGSFTIDATNRTAAALQMYSIGLISQGLIVYLNRVYFASGDTRTPLFVGMVTACLHVLVCWPAVKLFGYLGIAIGTSFYSMIYFALLLVLLGKKIKTPVRIFLKSVWRPLLASLGMLVILYITNSKTSMIGVLLSIVVSSASYFAFSFALRDPNCQNIFLNMARIFRKYKI